MRDKSSSNQENAVNYIYWSRSFPSLNKLASSVQNDAIAGILPATKKTSTENVHTP